VSPGGHVKNLFYKLRLLKAFAAYVKDPTSKEATAGIINSVRNLRMSGQEERFQEMINHLFADPATCELVEARYRPPHVDLDQLLTLAPSTLGYQYARHMRDHHLNPNVYPPTAITSDIQYISFRIFQLHDIVHTLLGLGTDLDSEFAVVAYTLAQVRSPLAGLFIADGILNAIFCSPNALASRMSGIVEMYNLGRQTQAFLGIRWEDPWSSSLSDLRRHLGFPMANEDKSQNVLEDSFFKRQPSLS
jgi:ubiquinone biosynthesis protein Coq4